MAFNDKSLIVNIEDTDSFNVDINKDLVFGHWPFIHNSSIIGGIGERFGGFIVFFEDFDDDDDDELCAVDRKRFDDVVVLAPPIAVLTAATVDEEFVNWR